MAHPRLQISDTLGDRDVTIEHFPFSIGRRETNDLKLPGSEVSREHAEIVSDGQQISIRDRDSRYGTYVNGEKVTSECALRSGDKIRLGRGGGADLVFLSADAAAQTSTRSTTAARDDLRQITSLLEGFRALGSGRVLQEVLALVLDAAIDLSDAERAFIMLSGTDNVLEFKLARGRDKQTLTDSTFAVSRKVPEEVFRTGKAKVVADLFDTGIGERSRRHGRARHPSRRLHSAALRAVRGVGGREERGPAHRRPVPRQPRAGHAAVREHARRRSRRSRRKRRSPSRTRRLYREKLEKARLEQEMRIAAEIQQALLPKPRASMGFVEAAAASVPCRSIGGDFFDYIDQVGTSFGFTLGDVAGKGPPAALMSAMMQGMFAAQAPGSEGPASAITRFNKALCRRGIEAQVRHAALRSAHSRRQADVLQRRPQPAHRARQEGSSPARSRWTGRRPARSGAVLAGHRAARRRRRHRALQRRRVRGVQRHR